MDYSDVIANMKQYDDFKNVKYVYFLIDDEEIVYVGQTNNVKNRLKSHFKDGKNFTHYHYIETTVEEVDSLEEYYIDKFIPKYNSKYKGYNYVLIDYFLEKYDLCDELIIKLLDKVDRWGEKYNMINGKIMLENYLYKKYRESDEYKLKKEIKEQRDLDKVLLYL